MLIKTRLENVVLSILFNTALPRPIQAQQYLSTTMNNMGSKKLFNPVLIHAGLKFMAMQYCYHGSHP